MKPDMSPKAVATRLRRASQLRRLCLSLGRAGRAGAKGSAGRAEAPQMPATEP